MNQHPSFTFNSKETAGALKRLQMTTFVKNNSELSQLLNKENFENIINHATSLSGDDTKQANDIALSPTHISEGIIKYIQEKEKEKENTGVVSDETLLKSIKTELMEMSFQKWFLRLQNDFKTSLVNQCIKELGYNGNRLNTDQFKEIVKSLLNKLGTPYEKGVRANMDTLISHFSHPGVHIMQLITGIGILLDE